MRQPRYVKRTSHIDPTTVRFIPVKDGDVVELGDTAPNTTSFYASRPRHIYLGFKPGAGTKATGWIVVLVDERAPTASKPMKHRALREVSAPRPIRRIAPPEHPVDEKARLVKDIRSMVPFIEGEHPDLAAELRRAMDLVESAS